MFKAFRSLRWRLQAWHALILLYVVLGFGLVLYWEIVRSRWNEVDDELIAAASVLEGALRAVPPGALNRGGELPLGPLPLAPRGRPPEDPFGEPPLGEARPAPRPPGAPGPPPRRPSSLEEGRRTPEGPANGFLPGPRESRRPPGGRPVPGWEEAIQLPRSLLDQLGRGDGPAYFVIWRRDGSVLRQSELPAESPPQRARGVSLLQRRELAREQRGAQRRIFLPGPHQTLICVGRGVRGEQDRLRGFATLLCLSGCGVLVAGLAGGWWLSGRAIAPIETMTRTASHIDAANLGQRMDLAPVDAELEELAMVLNHMLQRIDVAFQQQQQFTADASHELRTPLTVILSATELALSRERTPEEYRGHLEKCHRAALRMRGLVESLMWLTRLDAAGLDFERMDFDLQQVVEEGLKLLGPLAEQSQVTLYADLHSRIVRGCPVQLGQVAVNLVTNAILYNRGGGEVFVTLRDEPQGAVLTVRDTGVGIDPRDLPHLFDRFYRVDKSRSRTHGGSGLGLAICQRIIVAHGGAIRTESQPGVGSTFTVQLP